MIEQSARPRPSHWNNTRHEGYTPPTDSSKIESRAVEGIRFMAGEKVLIKRSSRPEEEEKIQEATLFRFNDKTGDAIVFFEDKFNNSEDPTARKSISRQELEELNPDGSWK